MLLSKAWASFEADKRIEGFSPQTLRAYQLQSLLLIDYFKDVDMELLDTNRLKEYLAISGKHLKPASLAHRIRFMKSFFRWSHEEGYLSKNPTSKIKEPKVGKRIPKYLTRNDHNSAIFVTARQPHKMSVAQMRYIIKRISKRAEINKAIHPHQLRHSYATHLLNNGAPIEVIQSLMGHEKSETTRIYAQLSGRLRKEYYQKYF